MKGKFLVSILAAFLGLAVGPVFSAQLPPNPGESLPQVQNPPKVAPQQPPPPAVPAVPVIPGRVRPPIIAPQVPQPGAVSPGQPGGGEFPNPQFTPPGPVPERRLLPPPAIPSGGMVSLNFTRADLVEIIHIIAQHLRLTYTIDPEVKGTVTINSAEPLRSEDLLPIFHQILRMNGAVAVRTGNLYQITTIKDGKGLARPIGQGREDSYAMQVVPVRFFSVAEMKRVLQPFVMPGGELIENPRGNFLIIVDIPSNIQRLVEIADLIDVQIFAGTRMEIYQPKVASAEELGQEMTKVMQSFASSAPQSDTFTAQFLPLPRINQLLVISHSEAAWTYARRWLERIDVVAEGPGRRIFIYPVENGKAGDLADVLSQALGLAVTGTRSQTPTLQSLHSGTPGASGQQSGMGGSSSSSFSQSGTNSQQRTTGGFSSFATIPVPGQPATSTGPTAAQPFPGAVSTPGAPRPTTPGAAPGAKPEEQLRVVADVGTNSLIIYGTAQEFQNIKNILKDLDAIPRQVLIEALIFQVDLKDTDDFGVNYQILAVPRTTIFGQTFGSRAALLSLGSALLPTPPGTGQNFSNFVNGLSGIVGDDTVKALIRALATDSRAKILSAPSVLATDNRPARIQVGTEEPIATGSVSSSFGTPNNTVSNSIQYRNTGRIMTIIPQVNSQGLVNLQIKAEVSARGDDVTVGDQKFPSFNTQDAETSAVVHDGETLVIGGLIGEIKTKGRSGLPYLMDLPVVGRFFGSTSETSTKTELIMLITPRVIRNREESRMVTEEFKNKLNTVRNELEKFRADSERDQEKQRRLRQPLRAPATQIPQGDIPIQPSPPSAQPAQPAPAQSQFPYAPTNQDLPSKQQSTLTLPMNPESGTSAGLTQTPVPAVPQTAVQPPVPAQIVRPAPTMVASVAESDNPESQRVALGAASNDPIDTVLNNIESKGMSEAKNVRPSQSDKQTPVWVVQVASYGREADALSYASKLKGKGYDTLVSMTDIAGKTRFRVEVGPLATRNEALALQKTLRTAQRIEDSLVMSKLPALAGEDR